MSVELPPELRELKDTLTERFVAGIRKSFAPCPLIGPKWLQGFPNGNPADLRFFGVRKLAKALGRPADAVMAILMKNVSFDGLDVDIRLREGVFIDVYRKKSATGVPPVKDNAGILAIKETTAVPPAPVIPNNQPSKANPGNQPQAPKPGNQPPQKFPQKPFGKGKPQAKGKPGAGPAKGKPGFPPGKKDNKKKFKGPKDQ